MPFGMIGRVGPREHELDVDADLPAERGNFRGGYGVDSGNERGECGFGRSGGAACSQITL